MKIHSSMSLSLAAPFGDREPYCSRDLCGIMAGAKPLAQQCSSGLSARPVLITNARQRLLGRRRQREGFRAKPLRRIQTP
jgi:hypothetical protein